MDFTAYFRVSTRQQKESGLGLAAQRSAVKAYVKSQGDGAVLKSFTETESGRKGDDKRPELAKALLHSKRTKSTLLVAKLDRLSRNVAFLSALMESKVDFVAVDNPSASKLTVHILAAVAEHEAELISLRTKAGLAEAKKNGVLLGSSRPGHWRGREKARLAGLAKAREKSAESRRQAFIEDYEDVAPLVRSLREAGQSFQQIADQLNADGYTTRRGKKFHKAQVSRILGLVGA